MTSGIVEVISLNFSCDQPLLREEFHLPELILHSDLRRRAAPRLALPCTSSYYYYLRGPTSKGEGKRGRGRGGNRKGGQGKGGNRKEGRGGEDRGGITFLASGRRSHSYATADSAGYINEFGYFRHTEQLTTAFIHLCRLSISLIIPNSTQCLLLALTPSKFVGAEYEFLPKISFLSILFLHFVFYLNNLR